MTDIEEFPSIHWKKWFDKFPEIDSLPVENWQVVHILSYWDKKYKEYYGFHFTWTMSGSPSKSYDAVVIKKIGQMLSTKPLIIKNYIDWIFQQKVQLRNKKITSLGYLANKEILNDYKFNILFKESTITRSTQIPDLWKDLSINHGYDSIETYGDLAFLKLHANQSEDAKILLNKIAATGFDISKLEGL